MKPVIHYMIGPTGSSAISYTDKRTTDFRSAEKSYYGRYGDNLADPLTKALSRQYCERLLPWLTGDGDEMPALPIPAKM